MMPEEWRQMITLQLLTVVRITTFLFQSLEVRQSNGFLAILRPRKLFGSWDPWWHEFSIPLCDMVPFLSEVRAASQASGSLCPLPSLRGSSLHSCSCPSLSGALTSLFPVQPSHPQGTQAEKTGKLCLWSPQQKLPWDRGTPRARLPFRITEMGKSNQNNYYQPLLGV